MKAMNAIFLLLVSFQAALAQTSDADQVLKSYAGALTILRWDGSPDQKIAVKDLQKRTSAPCDIVIEIRKTKLDKNQLQFEYARAGLVRISGKPSAPACSGPDEGKLAITGIDKQANLVDVLQKVFLSPEVYLASAGISFNLPPGIDESPGERWKQTGIPIQGLAPFKPLLQATPTYTNETRRARITGAVRVNVVVGSDGRLHSPKVLSGLEKSLDERSVRILSLWRFEPARFQDTPTPMSTELTFTFNMR
jgi:TonB family protein